MRHDMMLFEPSLLKKQIIILHLIVVVLSLFVGCSMLLFFREEIVMFHGVFQIEYLPIFCNEKTHLLYNLPPHPNVDRVYSGASCIVGLLQPGFQSRRKMI